MNTLPEHLQKRIDEMAHTYDLNCWRNETYQYPPETRDSFKEGAFAMHSLMLEELKPLVVALQCYARDNAKTTTNECGTGVVTCLAREALSHYRQKIEGVK